MKWRKGFGLVILAAVPPFPYQAINNKYNPRGLRISFSEKLTEADWKHLHFSEVSQKTSRTWANGGEGESSESEFIVSGKSGYVMCVTGIAASVQKARDRAYSLIEKIVIPKMFYRNNIGLKFIERDRSLLKKWGYL